MSMDFNSFIGKRHSMIENKCGFNYYIELLDRLQLGKDQDHKRIVDAFLRFVGDRSITVLKMCNDVVDEVIDVSQEDIRKNLYLLGDEKGLFYDEDWDVSFAFVGDTFFAYILPNMLMFSSDKKNIEVMSKILDDFSLKYVGPELRPDVDIVEKPSKYFQLQISLQGVKPLIWRRFIVKDDITFHELHRIIQIVMGWENYHAYEFVINDTCVEGEGDSEFCVDSIWRGFYSKGKRVASREAFVRDFLTSEKQQFEYIYDLGDNWVHRIVVEKILSTCEYEAVVLDGARCCPPEDSGGVHGYLEMLEIKKDPSHELYQEYIVDWLGEDFDPEFFDKQMINRQLSDVRNWREGNAAPSGYSNVKMRKLGRNEPCYCGSGKKYKKCCLPKDLKELGRQRKIAV